ncbi:MAG TPA: LPS assembly lipoprotein LptE [Rhodocyclaceae bacterium]
MQRGRQRSIRGTAHLAAAALLLAIAGCGFALRGAIHIPYDPLHLAIPAYSNFGAQLKRAVIAQGSARLTEIPGEAMAILTPTGEAREKTILSLNSAGRAREFQLQYRYSFRLHDHGGRDLIEPATIVLTRDMSFDDAAVLAKEQEEALLWRDMESDLVQQVLRRLAVSPQPVAGSVAR